ncbi:MAG: hypothetical protein WCO13_01875 [Bacteroidota bacterium]
MHLNIIIRQIQRFNLIFVFIHPDIMMQKYSFVSVFKKSYIFLLCAVLLFSCDKFDGDQTIPAYIHIEKISLDRNPSLLYKEGSLSNKITDAWVYIDDELIGAFELPATFPVLKKGKHIIIIYPGIKMNGISGTRVQYDFYKKISISDSTLKEGNILQIDTMVTRTSYKDNTVFWIEDFESSILKFQKRNNSDTTIVQTLAPANFFDGSPSGIVTIKSNQTFFEIETKVDGNGDNFILPKSASPVFLEMNYKTNNSVYVGLLTFSAANQILPTAQVSTIVLKPSTEWKKIYINFTPDISDYYNAYSFKVFIGGYKDEGIQTAEILLDNIKLVHFPLIK